MTAPYAKRPGAQFAGSLKDDAPKGAVRWIPMKEDDISKDDYFGLDRTLPPGGLFLNARPPGPLRERIAARLSFFWQHMRTAFRGIE